MPAMLWVLLRRKPGVRNAKAEECTTPYMPRATARAIILAWVGYIATKFAKNSPAKIS